MVRQKINVDDIVTSSSSKKLYQQYNTNLNYLNDNNNNNNNNRNKQSGKLLPPGILQGEDEMVDDDYEDIDQSIRTVSSSTSEGLLDNGIDDNKYDTEAKIKSRTTKIKAQMLTQISTIKIKASSKENHNKKLHSGLSNLLSATLKKDVLNKQNEFLNKKRSPSKQLEEEETTELPSVNKKTKDQKTKPTVTPYTTFQTKKADPKQYSSSIVLNLDKYKIDNVNPQPPKKSITFAENDPSQKKDTINLGYGDIPKPVQRTGSTVNPSNVKITKNPTIIRHKKEFLTANLSPRESNDYKSTTTRTSLDNLDEESVPIGVNPAIQVTKSLPSYDEALRLAHETITSIPRVPPPNKLLSASTPQSINPNQNQINNNNNNNDNYHSHGSSTNGKVSMVNTKSVDNINTIMSNQQQTQNGLINNKNQNNQILAANGIRTSHLPNINPNSNKQSTSNGGSKAYFKPNDLNAAQRAQQLGYYTNTSYSNSNNQNVVNGNMVNGNPNGVVDTYSMQRNAIERLYNGQPVYNKMPQQNNNNKINGNIVNVQPPGTTATASPTLSNHHNQQHYKSTNDVVASPPPATTPRSILINTVNRQAQRPGSSLSQNTTESPDQYLNEKRQAPPPPPPSSSQNQQLHIITNPNKLTNWKTTSSQGTPTSPGNDTNNLTPKSTTPTNRSHQNNNEQYGSNTKHINEDIVLQPRDSYSITGSSNGSTDYNHMAYTGNNNNNNNMQNGTKTIHVNNNNNNNRQSPTIPPHLNKQQHVNGNFNEERSPSSQKKKTEQQIQQQLQQQQQQQQLSSQTSSTLAINNKSVTTSQVASHINLAFIEEDQQQNHHQIHKPPKREEYNSESYDSSTLSTTSSIVRVPSKQKLNSNTNTLTRNQTGTNSAMSKHKQRDPELGRVFNGGSNKQASVQNNNNNAQNTSNIAVNNSTGTASYTSPILDAAHQQQQQQQQQQTKSNGSRPPCRLNFYEKDSDTNTNSELMPPNPPGSIIGNAISGISKTYPALMKDNIISDSPSLSDITDSKFVGNGDGGGRTSTPNLSKRKRSSSINSREVKHMRRQIEDLEKMYQEILRLLEADKDSINSKGSVHSSTTISSFTSSKDSNSRKPRRFASSYQPPNGLTNNSTKSMEFKQVNRRFTRLESHVTNLAKTVAHISSEIQSIKSIEEEIYNLRKDFNSMRQFPNPRSQSEPNFFQNSQVPSHLPVIAGAMNNSQNFYQNTQSSNSPNQELLRNCVPTFSNPKRIHKLTKFFGEEPPMLRLFLQKLGYEMYAPNFENERITITELPYCSEERLKTLGIPLGPRLRILQEAQLSFRNENYNIV